MLKQETPAWGTALLVFLLIAGCTMANYGRLEPNAEVRRQFKACQALPGYRYYYRGTFSQPIAIVGINPKFHLESKLWVPIDPESEKFRALIGKVSLQTNGPVEPWGFVVRDAAGQRVGVWYSAVRDVSIDVTGDGRITSLLPQPRLALGRQPR